MPCLLPIMPMVVVSSTQVSLMLRLGGPPVTPDDHAGAVDAGGTASQRVAAARAALRERVVVLTRAAAAAGPETNEVECGKVWCHAIPRQCHVSHRQLAGHSPLTPSRTSEEPCSAAAPPLLAQHSCSCPQCDKARYHFPLRASVTAVVTTPAVQLAAEAAQAATPQPAQHLWRSMTR